MAAYSASAPRQFRLQLTLRQTMKLVVLAAVASACLAVGVEHGAMFPQAWFGVVMTEAVVIPLVLAVVAFPLVRQGPLKDWLILRTALRSNRDGLDRRLYLPGPRNLALLQRSAFLPVSLGHYGYGSNPITRNSDMVVLDLLARQVPELSAIQANSLFKRTLALGTT